MKRVIVGLALVAAGLPLWAYTQRTQPHSYVPSQGFVPDSITAVRIAVAVWSPIYGEAQIRGEQPYRARLRDSIWVVEGSLPPRTPGGVAVAEIARRDGRILRVSHGR